MTPMLRRRVFDVPSLERRERNEHPNIPNTNRTRTNIPNIPGWGIGIEAERLAASARCGRLLTGQRLFGRAPVLIDREAQLAPPLAAFCAQVLPRPVLRWWPIALTACAYGFLLFVTLCYGIRGRA
jgi:hypothetical protein